MGRPRGLFIRKEPIMADETNTPVAGAENATQNAEVDTSVKAQEESLKKNFPTLIGYLYMSDPDNTNPLWHHYVMPVFDEKAYENLPWHVYKERPSDDLVDPLYSVQKGGWIENAHDAQTQILADAQAKIKELDEKGKQLDQATDKVDQAVKAMQQVQLQNTQQNVAMMKSFTAQTQNTNKLLASMQQTLALVVKANQANATPVAPAQSQPTASTTDASASQTQPVSDNQ